MRGSGLAASVARDFCGRVVVLGYGTIGRCVLPMLLDDLPVPARDYVVVDPDPARIADLPPGCGRQVARVERDAVGRVLGRLCRTGDLLVNLTVGVDSLDVADWCHRNGVAYVDSSIEPWEEHVWDETVTPAARTEYAHHQRLREHAARRWRADGPTVVVCHGANPGLVSHFVKVALLEVGEAMGMAPSTPSDRSGWAALARATGTRVIHVSERDTQVARVPKRPDEFVNTWSIEGFVEEASMPAEFGWGTHEKRLPPGGREHTDGPRNAIYCERPAARMWLRSWVPLGGQIDGLALPHSESVTISDFLTEWTDGRPSYRPTVAFAYLPCDAAVASLHEAVMRDWRMQKGARILGEDIEDGRDELGVLLLGHELNGWWLGSQLDVHEARRIAPGCNSTAVQVAAGVLAAAAWAAGNPRRGYCEPEDLPHDVVLDIARPYLGPMPSGPTQWHPLRGRSGLFRERAVDPGDRWQFGNFLVG